MHPLLTILLAMAAAAAAAPLAEQQALRALRRGYAGGFARYEPARAAVSHMRQQLFAAAAPRAHLAPLAPLATGFHTRTLHSAPYGAATAFAPAYAPAYATASSYVPAYAPASSYHHTYATSSSYHPAYAATAPSYQPSYAASTFSPVYDAADEYYVEESEEEPVYFTEASDAVLLAASAAPEIYDTVMYARPNERGGYSYRRRPGRRPARRPPPRRSPVIIKIHKRKIIRD